MVIPAFGPWSEQDHIGEKQAGMIQRAQLAETTPTSVDHVNQTAVFHGSKIYEVSLDHCSCGGFKGKYPCKHIYRLAMELGIIDLPYKTGVSKGEFLETQMSFDDALYELEKLPFDALYEARWMLMQDKQLRSSPRLFTDQVVIDAFRASPLFDEVDEHTTISMALSQLKRATLNQMAAASGIENPPKKNASSAVISQWLMDNVPNLSDFLPPCAAFSYIPAFNKAQPTAIKWFNQAETVCEEVGLTMEQAFPELAQMMHDQHLMPLEAAISLIDPEDDPE